MKVLIIDDVRNNRKFLKSLLREYFPEIEVIDESESVSSSIELLSMENYELILLDIELKDGVGFDILNEITDYAYVVVVSAYKEYALDAFKYNVTDYILKPLVIDDLKNAVNKVLNMVRREEDRKEPAEFNAHSLNEAKAEGNVLIYYKNEYIAIAKKDIVYIKAQGRYSEVCLTNGQRIVSYKNLKEFEKALPDLMVRAHHSYLVSLFHVLSFSRDKSMLILSTKEEVPVSIRKKELLFKHFDVF
jgi:two-component system, LytTR family, response regulator